MRWSTVERKRQYAGYSSHTPPLVENPNLGVRLENIIKENLDTTTKEFVNSLLEFFNKNKGLTERQVYAFEKIESRWSPQEKFKFEQWKEEYLKNHFKDAKILASYYSRTGYFTGLSSKILEEEGFIPTHKAFNKMVKNKYAQKVLAAVQSEPKFAKNDKVQIRSTVGKSAGLRHLDSLRNRLCFILATDLPIVNATAGAKRYKVLPMGETHPVEIDERHLMKPNRKGKHAK
tara:strand:+ start:4571 stop:5266 length:696 start_codon:yes stop_codon:yes gene_type:complete